MMSGRRSFQPFPAELPGGSAAGGGGGSGSGSYNVPIGQLPYGGGAGLYAIPSDYDLFPAIGPPWGQSHAYVFPWAAKLTTIRLRGDPSIGTTNDLMANPTSPPVTGNHASASSGAAQVTTLSVTLSSVNAGDSVYVAVSHDDGQVLSTMADNSPDSTGWTLTAYNFVSGSSLVIEWWRSDDVPATAPFTITGTLQNPGHCVMQAIQIIGANPTGSFDASGAGPTNSNSDTVTPSQVNDLCLLAVADLQDVGSYSAAGGSTLIDSQAGDGGVTQYIAAADLSQLAGPPSVPVTISSSFSGLQTAGMYGAMAVAVKAAGAPFPVNADLWVNGAFVETLATIAAGATTFDVVATPDTVIPAGAIVNIVLDLSAYNSGQLNNWLVAFAVTED
jgi:hypothetical protein